MSKNSHLAALRRNLGITSILNKKSKEEINIIYSLLDIIERLLSGEPSPVPERKLRLVLLARFNNQTFIVMSLSIATNQSAPIIPGLIDDETNLQVTATFAGTTNTVDDPTLASIDANGNLVGIAAGSGNLTTKTNGTYTDTLGNQQTATFTTTTPFTITAVVVADKVSLVVTLGTPVTQVTTAPAAAATTN